MDLFDLSGTEGTRPMRIVAAMVGSLLGGLLGVGLGAAQSA